MGSEHVQLLKALCLYHLGKRSKHRRGKGLSRSSRGDRQPSSLAAGGMVPSLVLPGPPLAWAETPTASRLPTASPGPPGEPPSLRRQKQGTEGGMEVLIFQPPSAPSPPVFWTAPLQGCRLTAPSFLSHANQLGLGSIPQCAVG